MQMKIYDTSTRKKQSLVAKGQQELSIYVCGPTVYDRIHVGNARTFVVFQTLVNYLRFCGITVRHVSNITDVNDKIYVAAKERGLASSELAEQATQWYIEDTSALGLGRPDVEPRATQSLSSIIALIESLVDKGLAYEASGDVYFRVREYRDYGKLSNRTLDDMVAGSREELDAGEHKEDPLDFTLWKATKKSEDTSWDSPWGKGRPGWHIECSAMAQQELGDEFDVHGGGIDLLFPHHENEVAQSRASGQVFARIWMHAGMLEAGDGTKMSKSVGNIESLRSALDRLPAWQIVLFYLSGSWRSPLAWSEKGLHDAAALGDRITETLRRSQRFLGSVETRGTGDESFADSGREWEGIHEALRDDFNTAEAIKELHGILYDLNTAVDEHATPQLVRNMRKSVLEFMSVFGLGALEPGEVDVSTEVHALIEQRDAARLRKDFEESDRIRNQLEAMGYVVRDTDLGTELIDSEDGDSSSGSSDDSDG